MNDERKERRERSIKVIKKLGLPCNQGLPFMVDEESMELPAVAEIARRCVAVGICAVKGETNNQAMVNQMVGEFSAATYFTPRERQFIEDTKPLQSDLIFFGWLYECVHVFLWTLGYLGRIKPANKISDVVTDMGLIWQMGTTSLMEEARLRPKADILDAADLYNNLHWATEQLSVKGLKSKKINGDIIMMRYYTLNWLINHRQEQWHPIS